MAVYTAHVHWRVMGSVLPDPSGFTSAAEAPSFGVSFIARDASGGNQAWFGIIVKAQWVAGAWVSRVESRWNSIGFAGGDFSTAGLVLDTDDTADDGDLVYDGGRLTIEKDEAGDAIRFNWPGGSYSQSLSSLGMLNANGMFGETLEVHQSYGSVSTPAFDHQFLWKAFWTEVDDVRVRGASMSSVQPGSWAVVAWNLPINSAGVTKVHTQRAQEDEVQMHSATDTTDSRALAERRWNGGNTIPKFARELDMTEAPEHGILWRVFSLSATPETLYIERTHDNGLTWRRITVHTGTTNPDNPEPVVYTPNVAWYRGRLLVVWHDGQDVVQRISHDMGEHWEALDTVLTGVTGLTQVVPRVVIHPQHGLTYYLWVVAETGQLELARSGDFGVGAPTLVSVHPGALTTWLDAWISLDGFIRVAYEKVDGAHASLSADIGERWDADPEFPTGTRRQRSRYAMPLGLSYHTYWESPATVKAYASPNHGALPTPTLSANTVATGLPEQTPAVAVLASGGAMVSYVDTDESLLEKTSVDFGVSWDA